VTIASRPSYGTGWPIFKTDFSNGESGIFFAAGLDFELPDARVICPSGKINAGVAWVK
jgi:hypothetical protein